MSTVRFVGYQARMVTIPKVPYGIIIGFFLRGLTVTRIIIAGSRTFQSYHKLEVECDRIIKSLSTPPLKIEIVSGHANGTDKLGEKYANMRGYGLKTFAADWGNLEAKPCFVKTRWDGTKYNALAGHNRNKDMAIYAADDHGILVAFWDYKSSGTRNMIALAKEYMLWVFVIRI